jgi:hypothetical protein
MLWYSHGLGRIACDRQPLHVSRGVFASVQRWRHVLANADSKRIARAKRGLLKRGSSRGHIAGRLGLDCYSQGGTWEIVSSFLRGRIAGRPSWSGLRYSCSWWSTGEAASGFLLFYGGPDDGLNAAHVGCGQFRK